MKVLVTGANGFVGKNLIEFLKTKENIEIFEYDIESTEDDLDCYCKSCDIVVNLAGVNRTTDNNQFLIGNLGVIEKVANSLKKNNNKSPIIFSSSIQAELDNPYGLSKKAGEDFVFEFGKSCGVNTYVYRFPNLFGKWGVPNYNSVVTTFCYNIARDLEITISDRDRVLTLAYIDDVVKELYNAICGKPNKQENGFCEIPVTYQVTLGDLADMIYRFKSSRNDLSVIDTANNFEKNLYSTYLSYLPEDSFSYDIKSNIDNRGLFAEIIRTESSGQFSVNIAKPGITKGNHWHNTKNEKFLVVKGQATVKFRKPFSKEIIEYNVSGDKLEVVDIPCGYTHNITNVGNEDLVFFIWCNECFDRENPDTYFLEV